MPERVTKEERLVSMVIEKAREVKELLHLSLNDNNRSPIDDKSEVFKLKRPKAENYTVKFQANKGPINEHGFAGETYNFKKAISLMKAILKEDMDNPFLNEERKRQAIADLEATEKELDDLQQMFRSGMNQVEFQEKFGAMLRRLTEMQQMLGGQPDKDPAVPLLPNQNKYR
tara:strand:+ start:3702 stop:4217 length:516 start_codon:yes stop_codon:yes gene_type:complete